MELARHLPAIVECMSCSASHGGKTHLSLTNAAVRTQQLEVGVVGHTAYSVCMVSTLRSLSSTFVNMPLSASKPDLFVFKVSLCD